MMYRIRDWDRLFEKAQTRKVRTLHWVAIPVHHDDPAYGRVVSHERGAELYCAWIALLTVAARAPVRGLLATADGQPYTSDDLHYATRLPSDIFDLAFKVLTSPEIGWLEVIDDEGVIGNA